jgi:hypothetical protein
MGLLMRTLTVLVALSPAAAPQTPDVAHVERSGDSAVLSVHTFRPLDAVATALESQLGIAVSAEDPCLSIPRRHDGHIARSSQSSLRNSCAGAVGILRSDSR